MTIERGLDVTKFEGFSKWLKQNPSKGILGLEANVIYEGTVGRSIARLGPYRLDDKVIDRPRRNNTRYAMLRGVNIADRTIATASLSIR